MTLILLKRTFAALLSVSVLRSYNAAKLDFNFNYSDTESWKTEFPHCGGKHQSPIALSLKDTENTNFESPLLIKGLDLVPEKLILRNTGHHVVIRVIFENEKATLSGGPLGKDVYALYSTLFFWSQDDNGGSQHEIDDTSSSMAMEVTYYNTKYSDYKSAIDKEDGLAVVSEFLQINDDPEQKAKLNSGIPELLPFLSKIREPGTETSNKITKLDHFVPETDVRSKRIMYLIYKGSMTMPPCYESVTWLVNIHPLFVTSDTVNEFRKINLLNNDTRNYRPVQPQNGRIVSLLSADL